MRILGFTAMLITIAGLFVIIMGVGPEKTNTQPPTTIYYTIPITPDPDNSYWIVKQSDLLRTVPIYAHPYTYTRAVGLIQYSIPNSTYNYYTYVYELDIRQGITYQVGSVLYLTSPDSRNVCHLYRQNVDLPNMKTLKVVE